MEEISRLLLAPLRFVVWVVWELFFREVLGWFWDKCYRNFPKTTIFVCGLLLVLAGYGIVTLLNKT
ncbi:MULTISPECIES: hypothetical protein [Moraxella]|uniref:Uncharacterized protein n=1 Tax=Moraxella lacunata TaxID=477 RepID=A0A1B8Q323_MORLA|nr:MULTISPECIES: hypothetical protein [Moraxella]MBE9579584.1 hypothetical protein [Moraxella sp. K1664]MBE9588934.1 hypothetical protein [Moraxella sp. K1630]MBE9591503.1 hypothetical protein [Moraxella sp. K127]MBE9597374.1 hypothetical protein [Moraxella sp. K2450]MDH9219692.1 hypothetical protein [Moraxella lacunata]